MTVIERKPYTTVVHQHCRRLGTSLDCIRYVHPDVYQDVLVLLALTLAVDAENRELRAALTPDDKEAVTT